MLPPPIYSDGQVTLYHADCRDLLPFLPDADVVVTDPPYGDTTLKWDVPVDGWMPHLLARSRQLWCFGSMRFFMARRDDFDGWRYAQEVVWEKHNGSGFASDRFKRVHELAGHWYRGTWADVYKEPPVTFDATARTVKRRGQTPHTGEIGSEVDYRTEDGGPRLMRSVIRCRSMNGSAIHETQKPTGILTPLVTYSCPPGGLVLDPFAGSASTLEAARETGRRAIGIEVDLKKAMDAAERLQSSLFAGAA